MTSPHVPTWDKCDFGTSMQPRCAPQWISGPHARAEGEFREAPHLSRGLQVSYGGELSRAHVRHVRHRVLLSVLSTTTRVRDLICVMCAHAAVRLGANPSPARQGAD